MSISKHSAERVAGREHIPLYPNGFIAIRIVQLVLALMVIGLAAFGLSVSAFDGDIFIMVVVSCSQYRSMNPPWRALGAHKLPIPRASSP